jgi:hypothetical protein
MSYSVKCECGQSRTVVATQAGSTIPCECGRPLDVPMLSILRRSAGEDPIPRTTVEQIRSMIDTGELPICEICPFSGRPTNDTMFFHIQCETIHLRGGMSKDKAFWYACWYTLIFGLIVLRRLGPPETLGRETSIKIPVRVSSASRSALIKLRGQRRLKKLLSDTPIYRELLREFPQAIVTPVQSI